MDTRDTAATNTFTQADIKGHRLIAKAMNNGLSVAITETDANDPHITV
jgi:hypothetical protein